MTFAALSLLASSLVLADEQPLKLALYDFKTNGASVELVAASKAVVANELGRAGLFKVTTSEALASLLALERQKQLFGCTDAGSSCMAEIADALGVDYLVTGTVTKLSGVVSLELSLLDAHKSRRESSQVLTGKNDSEILAGLTAAVAKLIAPVAAKRSGTLLLTVGERGASVKVDDTVRGSTPLKGQLTLPGGPHQVSIEKEGFVTAQKEVMIKSGQQVAESFTLVPSPDYLRAYESREKKLRLGAWISTAVAAAAAIGYGIARFEVSQLDGSTTSPNTFEYYKAKLVAHHEIENGVDNRLKAEGLSSQINLALTLSYVALGVAAAGAIAAAVFWIIGEDPSRYTMFKEVGTVSLSPVPGGGFVSAGLRF